MRRVGEGVTREHVKSQKRELREKILQSRKAPTAENMKCSGGKIKAIKAGNNLAHLKANLAI